MQTPTAPFREHWMCEALDNLLADIPGVELSADKYGNRLAHLGNGRNACLPVVFIAHLDHPGFVFEADGGNGKNLHDPRLLEARFEGRVEDSFFTGAPVRIFRSPTDKGVPARIVEFSKYIQESGDRRVFLKSEDPVEAPVLGMWDLPAVERTEGGFLRGRACDDLAGCAAMIEALRRLAEQDTSSRPLDVTMVFTRGEEAGFCGLLCLLEEEQLPGPLSREGLYLSVETSGELPAARLGEGAIIRCGDRSTTFDAHIVDLLHGLTRANGIRARRALMDLGTCEATAAARSGLRAGGICIPVRHYHNMDTRTGKIASEMISLSDAETLVEMIVEFTLASGEGREPGAVILHDYVKYLRKGQDRLVPVPLASHSM